jgi:predicted ester cyclase
VNLTAEGTSSRRSIPPLGRPGRGNHPVSVMVSHELPEQVENYARAFPDMHRELYRVYVSGSIVVVQLALQGTHLGPLHLPAGILPPTGKRMDAPCCDVFELIDGKIKRFDCYPEGTIILTQLGVFGHLDAALQH